MDTHFETPSGFEPQRDPGVDTRAHLVVEREVIGANVGANGYTTVSQADELSRLLRLRREDRLLDIGAGGGWPGLYLAEKSGCEATLLDISDADLRRSVQRAAGANVYSRCSFFRGTATALPFRPRSFEALVHTDVL